MITRSDISGKESTRLCPWIAQPRHSETRAPTPWHPAPAPSGWFTWSGSFCWWGASCRRRLRSWWFFDRCWWTDLMGMIQGIEIGPLNFSFPLIPFFSWIEWLRVTNVSLILQVNEAPAGSIVACAISSMEGSELGSSIATAAKIDCRCWKLILHILHHPTYSFLA